MATPIVTQNPPRNNPIRAIEGPKNGLREVEVLNRLNQVYQLLLEQAALRRMRMAEDAEEVEGGVSCR